MGFIQGTPDDCLSIHLFLGQASVSPLGITLVTRTLLQLRLGGVCKQSVVVLLCIEHIKDWVKEGLASSYSAGDASDFVYK
jgi:hypothetical protein